MRAILIAGLILLSAAPTTAAASTTLDIILDESTVEGNATIPVSFRLTLSEFVCHEPYTFILALSANTTEGVQAAFETSTVTIPVPARSYYGDPFSGEATVNLSTRALMDGDLGLTASFASDDGPCFVPGGFQPMQVTMVRAVHAGPATGGQSSGPDDVPETNATEERPTASMPTPTTQNNGACAPNKTCGTIGDFQPEESTGARSATPGVGLVSIIGAVACLALASRRRS